jgi:hypothetical protein
VNAKKLLNLTFLLILLAVSAGISSFHTEGPAGSDPLCPACHFQSAAVAEAQIDFVQLPALVLFDILALPFAPGHEFSSFPVAAARAPPIV